MIFLCLRYGIGSGPVAVGEIICEGNESHLLRCHYKQGADLGMLQECQSHVQDVGVVCGEFILCNCFLPCLLKLQCVTVMYYVLYMVTSVPQYVH